MKIINKEKKYIIVLMVLIFLVSIALNCYATDIQPENPPAETPAANPEPANNPSATTPEPETNTENQGSNAPSEPQAEPQSTPQTEIQPTSQPETQQQQESTHTSQNNNNNNRTNVYTYLEKSSNANLSSLEVNVDGLSPEFDKEVTEYYLIVDLNTSKIEITATVEDSKAIYFVEGNENLKEGENVVEVTVRAENGTLKTYTINVTKTDDAELSNANLKTLSVKGFDLYPSFKSNIYNYNLMINRKISKLNIEVETENEGASYEIEGNEDLQEGDNLIKVIVTAKDGEAKREYKINAFISSKVVKGQKVNKKEAFALMLVLTAAIFAVGITIIRHKE